MPLEARNISFRYHPKQPWILNDVSIRVEKGERAAIFAPSGYGKTTLALLLAGYLHPDRGQILLNGNPLPMKGICPVQLIMQHPERAVNPRWKLKHLLAEGGMQLSDIPEAFGLEAAWLERYPQELSGGELQRFCVARALMAHPDFLICDEISTMLDAITQAQIWTAILQEASARNIGILAITHNRHLALQIADHIMDLSETSQSAI